MLSVEPLEVIQMKEPHEGTTPAYSIVCPFVAYSTHDDIKTPDTVGITDKNYDDSDLERFVNFIAITYPREYESSENEYVTSIAVCPGPIQGNFQNALRITEYVEMNRILGASKFYFYNMSMSDEVKSLLKFYESQGLAEIVSWNIDDVLKIDESIIHYYGIMATLNDCFYRATVTDNFKYVLITDFDEIIFPKKTETLTEFLELYDSPAFHSFTFSNYFFFAEYPNDLTNVPKDAVNRFLYTQALLTRLEAATGDSKWYRVRTKFIAKRNSVTEVGNHFVWRNVKGSSEFFVNLNDAVMYHYRENCLNGYCGSNTAEDNFARKFSSEIYKRVDEVCGKVFSNGICPIGEITSRVD